MRDGADHLMIVEYDTKRMTTCPIRAVYCDGLEHDARVPLSEDLTTAKHGSTH